MRRETVIYQCVRLLIPPETNIRHHVTSANNTTVRILCKYSHWIFIFFYLESP